MRDKIGLIIEQRKIRAIMQDVGNRGKSIGSENPLKEWKTFSGSETHQGPKDSDPRIDVILKQLVQMGLLQQAWREFSQLMKATLEFKIWL